MQSQNYGGGVGGMSQTQGNGGGGGTGGAPAQPRQRVRARRGQATDPHSIAERVRSTSFKISLFMFINGLVRVELLR